MVTLKKLHEYAKKYLHNVSYANLNFGRIFKIVRNVSLHPNLSMYGGNAPAGYPGVARDWACERVRMHDTRSTTRYQSIELMKEFLQYLQLVNQIISQIYYFTSLKTFTLSPALCMVLATSGFSLHLGFEKCALV